MPHVDDARLHAYLDGELHWLGEDPSQLERHFGGCAECRARLEEAKRLREHARSLLGGHLPVERPPFEAVLRRANGGSEQLAVRRSASGGSERSSVRRRVPTAVWAASLVLALAGGWLARGIVRVGDPAATRDGVQVASAPVPEKWAATAQAEDAAGPPAPTPAAVESTPPDEPLVEASARRSAEPAAVAVPVRPGAQRAASEPLAAEVPTTSESGRMESEPLAAQVPSMSEEGGRIEMIEGKVTDESGRVIPGAVVHVRGLAVGTLTAPDGTYSLVMPEEIAERSDGLVITAAALGWEPATQPLSPADDRAVTRDFRLRPAQVALEGVVAVGLGSSRTLANAEIGERTDAEEWAPAAPEEIRRLLGRDALRIAGMRALETAIGRVDGVWTVRVRQALPGGAVATLLQSAEPRGGSAVSAAAAVDRRSPARGSPDGAEAEATAWRDGVRIVARAAVAADSLVMLLERLE